MDDARKLLDSLMGQTRNLELKEAKKKKGNNFKEPNSCKFYLLGFCPQYEQLFRNTKRHLGECSLIHSVALKEEFESHPEREDYERKYVRDLIKYMEGIVRTADEAVSRQARNIQAANKDLEERGPNDVAKREIEKIRENCNTLLNEAEELAEKGDIEGSKTKQAIFEETKRKADEYEVKSKQPIKEEVCEICGLRPEDGDGMRKFSHTEGKIHIGFVKVRDWLKRMRLKQDEFEDRHVGLKGDQKDRVRSKSRDRKRRSKSRRDPQTDQPIKDRKDKDDRKDREDRKDKEGDGETKESAKADGEPAAAAAADGEKVEADADKEPRERDRDRGRDRDNRRGGDRDAEASSDRRGDRGGERGSRGGGDRRGDRGHDGDRRERDGGGRGDRDRGDRGGDRGERRQRSRSRDRRRQ